MVITQNVQLELCKRISSRYLALILPNFIVRHITGVTFYRHEASFEFTGWVQIQNSQT